MNNSGPNGLTTTAAYFVFDKTRSQHPLKATEPSIRGGLFADPIVTDVKTGNSIGIQSRIACGGPSPDFTRVDVRVPARVDAAA